MKDPSEDRHGGVRNAKVAVVTNDRGEILAIGPAAGALPGDEGGPIHGRFEPLKGQRVVDVDFTDELSELLTDEKRLLDLANTHRVESKGRGGRIVPRERH
ncbi:MAG TPA: hypothetical protein VFM93_03925 [Candidatus Limnocylindria bacterium]|nr:hypothetical protein [Candidatus Limnocylindria bacterium]